MEHLLDSMRGDSVYALRILIAMIFGGLVGLERQARGRPAGLRTNILVCIGSAAIIVAFQKVSGEFNVGAESVIRMDPARAAAGVITGIGFLGAGTIVKSNDFVRGLTTAASIWVVSAVRRVITSPVRPASNHDGGKVRRWSNTLRRRSAVTRSPSHDTL